MIDLQEERVASLFVIPFVLIITSLFLFVALLNGNMELIILTILILCVACGVRLWTRISLAGLTCNTLLEKEKVFQ